MVQLTEDEVIDDVGALSRATLDGPVMVMHGDATAFIAVHPEHFKRLASQKTPTSTDEDYFIDMTGYPDTLKEHLRQSPDFKRRILEARAWLRALPSSSDKRSLAEVFAMPEGTPDEILDFDLTQPRVIEPWRELDFS